MCPLNDNLLRWFFEQPKTELGGHHSESSDDQVSNVSHANSSINERHFLLFCSCSSVSSFRKQRKACIAVQLGSFSASAISSSIRSMAVTLVIPPLLLLFDRQGNTLCLDAPQNIFCKCHNDSTTCNRLLCRSNRNLDWKPFSMPPFTNIGSSNLTSRVARTAPESNRSTAKAPDRRPYIRRKIECVLLWTCADLSTNPFET